MSVRVASAAVLSMAVLAGCASKAERGSIQPQGTLREAASTPLADVNLKRVKIPEVLQQAVANPYDPRSMGDCRSIAAEIARLDEALGPDADEPPPPDTRNEIQKTAEGAHSAAVLVVTEGVKSVMPFRGWVRQLTGAARQQQAVREAINAGGVRRGYLKGVGMRLNCAPPAAPSWFKPTRIAAPSARPARQAPRTATR